MSVGRFLQQAAAGAGGVSVDDVFSTFLYTGNGSTQTITNGIDLDGEGGLVWIKNRDAAVNHQLHDTERGASVGLNSNNANAQYTDANAITSFNADGFSMNNNYNSHNQSGVNFASWTFRKQPGFFDVVTYTGNGTTQTINHSLGSVPGMIIVKSTSGAYDWAVYHRGVNGGTNSEQYGLYLNATQAQQDNDTLWNDTAPTSTQFSVGKSSGASSSTNANGATYVAYLFAHDAQEFGGQSIIKCGSYGPGTESLDGPEVTLGWEPQWLLTKAYGPSGYSGDWVITDSVRGVVTNGNDEFLRPNLSNGELTAELVNFTSTGFKIRSYYAYMNQNPLNYIYVAIAKGS